MTISTRFFLTNTVWTVGTYGFCQALRLVANIILARFLAPDVFGVMTIVNSIRSGIELLSDIGVGQNIIQHRNGNSPEFYNTAWTLQVIRGVGIWLVALSLAVPIAQFYESPILKFVVPLVAFSSVITGFSSVSPNLLRKRLQIVKINVFEAISTVIAAAASVFFVYLRPTIWALVFGILFGSLVSTIGTYFLLADVKQRFYLSKQYVTDILHFGKWIFASSIVYFLATNFDRLFFAKVVSLELLGIYGIARALSEVLGTTIIRFGSYVLFPLIASHAHMPRLELRGQLVSIRAKFLLMAGIGFSLIVAVADVPIKILYDERYQAASWMLPLLIIGSWFSLLSQINESSLLGLGKSSYSAIANTSKFVFLLAALPLSLMAFGLLGGVVVVAVSDLLRYFPILIGQRRERFSFGVQDLLVTLLAFLLIALWTWLRWISGFGTALDTLP